MSEHDAAEYETDAEIERYDTGGGYLVFRVRTEYDPTFDNTFLVEHRLIGFAEVEDWGAIRSALREHGMSENAVHDYPELA